MTVKTKLVGRLAELRIVVGAVDIVAGSAGHSVTVHHALHNVVALHPVLVCCAIGKVQEICLAKGDVFKLPVVRQMQTDAISDGPVISLAFNEAARGRP
jgi:hypothetical protein